jgi:predicted short-subunit dehydrogenase-like oxidoreductase (DUF2520 family)
MGREKGGPDKPGSKPSVAIVGCGTVGTALGGLLSAAGYPIIGVSTLRADTARKAADRLGAKRFSLLPWEITPEAEVVFITTPDDAIEPTCRAIAQKRGFAKNRIVLHCSGALASSVLAPARTCGAFVASLHPLQSFASVEQAERLVPGSYCTVEGDGPALPVARRIVEDVGGRLLEITPEGKTLYHAAAVVASNYLVTLVHLALTLNHLAGIPPGVSFTALRPLIEGTLTNIAAKGIPGALTGPIARGDVATVTAHLRAIQETAPELLEAYKILGRHTVGLAERQGSLTAEVSGRLLSLLRMQEPGNGH